VCKCVRVYVPVVVRLLGECVKECGTLDEGKARARMYARS